MTKKTIAETIREDLDLFCEGVWELPQTNKKDSKLICEGTWSLPNTKDKALELYFLMQDELPADIATDKIYNLIGDDLLYDIIADYQQGHDKDSHTIDVRFHIASRLNTLLDRYYMNPEEFKEPFDERAIKILQDIIKLHS